MSRIDKSTLKEDVCEESICELCCELHTDTVIWNYEHKEWDAVCVVCKRIIVNHGDDEYYIKQEKLW